MGLLDLLRDDPNFGVAKACFLNPVVQVVFLKAQPAVGVELACLLKTVGPEVQNEQAPTWFQDTEGLRKGFPWIFRMVEGLAEEGEVDTSVLQGDFFDIPKDVVNILKFFFISKFPSEFDHFWGVVYAMDEFGLPGQ